jgi:hypothetical protein
VSARALVAHTEVELPEFVSVAHVQDLVCERSSVIGLLKEAEEELFHSSIAALTKLSHRDN